MPALYKRLRDISLEHVLGTVRGHVLLAIFLTLLAITFITLNGEERGRIFWHLLTTHDLPAGWLLLGLLVAGSRFGEPGVEFSERVDWFLREFDRYRHPLAVALWVGLCIGTLEIYRNHPVSMDEYSALFQARIFAAGALSGQFPPDLVNQLIPPGFQKHFLMVNHATGAVMSAYWPGFSLLLAPFVFIGAPWACNPTIVVLSLLLIGRISKQLLHSEPARAWAMLLALASPAFVASGLTYYAMSAHLLLNLTFVWLLIALSPLRLFLAGVVGGFALSLHNPFPHFVFALPWLGWIAVRRSNRWRNVVCIAAGYLLMIGIFFLGWSFLRQGILSASAGGDAAQQIANTIGTVPEKRAMALFGSLARVLQWPNESIVYARLAGLAKVWLWASPLLLILAWKGGRREENIHIRLLVASALTTVFAYFAIRYDQGHGWGYRYFHPAWGTLPILAALGITKLIANSENPARDKAHLICLTLGGLLLCNALRAYQIGDFVSSHLDQRAPVHEGALQVHVQNGVGYYAVDLVQNDPFMRSQTIFMLEQDTSKHRKIAERFFPKGYLTERNKHGVTFFQK